jgi:ribosomal protein L11 methyltransferase
VPQTRLHVAIDNAGADRLFPALEAAFEEDGLPLSVFDLDEANGIKEVSLYALDGVEEIEHRLRAVMAGVGVDAAIARSSARHRLGRQVARRVAARPRRAVPCARLA